MLKSEQIQALFARFEAAVYELAGVECWSARELQQLLDYAKWQNFALVIDKAKDACSLTGEQVTDHFTDVSKVIPAGKGAKHELVDLALTRYACYLIAQNGDARKEAIAFAQTYFAVQTRKQELITQSLLDKERVGARKKLSQSEKKLSGVLFERGIDSKGFAAIRAKGDKAFFGGLSTQDMKRRYNVPDSRPLADFLPTLTIKAKDFVAEMTSHNVQEKGILGEKSIATEHIENNAEVRKMLEKRGIKPEALPPAEDVRKVETRLKAENKKASKPNLKKKS
jgi:DNA-damage-inducible protein D